MWWPKADLKGPSHLSSSMLSKWLLKLFPKSLSISLLVMSTKFLPRKKGSDSISKFKSIFENASIDLLFESLSDEKK